MLCRTFLPFPSLFHKPSLPLRKRYRIKVLLAPSSLRATAAMATAMEVGVSRRPLLRRSPTPGARCAGVFLPPVMHGFRGAVSTGGRHPSVRDGGSGHSPATSGRAPGSKYLSDLATVGELSVGVHEPRTIHSSLLIARSSLRGPRFRSIVGDGRRDARGAVVSQVCIGTSSLSLGAPAGS